MGGGDGADPVNDIVLVEIDGRLVAGTGVERKVRDGGPTYDIWGAVDPAFRRRGLGTALLGWTIDHARVRASREDPRTVVRVRTFSEDTETGHRALLEAAGFETVRHFFLMLRTGLDDVPDVALPDGPRDPPGRRGPVAHDLRRRERGLPRSLGPPRDDRR